MIASFALLLALSVSSCELVRDVSLPEQKRIVSVSSSDSMASPDRLLKPREVERFARLLDRERRGWSSWESVGSDHTEYALSFIYKIADGREGEVRVANDKVYQRLPGESNFFFKYPDSSYEWCSVAGFRTRKACDAFLR